MVSSKTPAGNVGDDDPVEVHGQAAVKLVTDGYREFTGAVKALKAQEGLASGTLAYEVLHKLPNTPVLLKASKYAELRELRAGIDSDDIIRIIWNILEVACGEHKLRPASAVNDDDDPIVILYRHR